MTYPVAVVGLVVLIMSAMLLFVVPQFKSIYDKLGGSLPLPTRILLMRRRPFKTYWWMFLGATLVAGSSSVAGRRPRRAGRDRGRARSSGSRCSGRCSTRRRSRGSRRTLAMLLHSGVPILQALDIVSDTVNNKVVSKAIIDVQASVREGESMAKPLAKHKVFPPMVVQMIAVGEETGPGRHDAREGRDFYDQEVEATVDALTSLIEPLLIAVIGGRGGRGGRRPLHADVQHHQADPVSPTYVATRRFYVRRTMALVPPVRVGGPEGSTLTVSVPISW